MAVTANLSYFGNGPVAGGSTILAFGGSSVLELSYIGVVSLVGDNSTTNCQVNFIDGTNALPWTPTAAIAFRNGGNATNTISVQAVSAITNSQCSVLLSSAPGTNATANVIVMLFK